MSRRVATVRRTDIDVTTPALHATLQLGPADRGGVAVSGVVRGANGRSTEDVLEELSAALHRLAGVFPSAPTA